MNVNRTGVGKFDVRRRGFLTVAACAPVVAVAALVARKPEIEMAPPSETTDRRKGTGYHETDHIRTYYYTAGYL
jgi:hypothetical protein